MKSVDRIFLITGSGLLGGALRNVLNTSGCDFVYLSRSDEDDKRKIYSDLSHSNINIPKNVTHVIYAAQSNFSKDFPFKASDLININFLHPVSLAKKCAEMGISFTYVSTGSVYKIKENFQPHFEVDALYNENLSPYIASKIFAEKTIMDINPNSLIVRPFFIFGNNSRKQSIFPKLIHAISNNEKIILNGDSGFLFNPISSKMCAEQIMFLLNISANGIFNLAGNSDLFLKDVLEFLYSIFKAEPNVVVNPGYQNFLASTSKILNFGYKYATDSRIELFDYLEESFKNV